LFPQAQNFASTTAGHAGADSPEFVAVVARAYTLSEIFPLHHPTVRDAMRDVASRVADLSAIVVQVARTGLVQGETPIADPHGHVREFARDLTLAGVSELGLNGTVTTDDVERLLTGLRVVTENPALALDEFLSREGGCSIELAFHNGPLAPMLPAYDPPAQEPAPAAEVDVLIVEHSNAEYPALDPFEVETIEPVRIEAVDGSADHGFDPSSVEREIEDELVLEPVGAFLNVSAPPEPTQLAVEETPLPDAELEFAEVETIGPAETTVPTDIHSDPDAADWLAEVRARLLVESRVEESEAELSAPGDVLLNDDDAESHDPPEGVSFDPPQNYELYEGSLEEPDLPQDPTPDAELPLYEEHWDAQAHAESWGAELESEVEEPDEILAAPETVAALPEVGSTIPLATASASSNGKTSDLPPLDPVLDESEIDSPVAAVPPDTHMAAPEESSFTIEASNATAAPPHFEQVQAFRAALRDSDEAELDPEEHFDPWEPDGEDDSVAEWDAEAVAWSDTETLAESAIAGTSAADLAQQFEAIPERFPPVEQLAPDGPSLFDSEPDLAEPPVTASEPEDPETLLLEMELAADLASAPQAFEEEGAPEEVSAPDESPATLVGLATEFVAGQAVERSALSQRIVEESARLGGVEDFEQIARGIEVLVRDAVPGDNAATELAGSLSVPEAIAVMCVHLAEVRDPDRRDELVYVFGQLSDRMAPALSVELSEVPPRAARRNYMDALFRMGHDAVSVAVPMLEDSRWFIVRNGVDVLGEAGDESSVAKLAPSLAHPDHRVRRATVMALAKLGGARAGNELVPVLEDPSAEVREGAAMALGHLRVMKAVRPLLALLERDKDDEVQMVILRSLGQIGDPGAVPAIEKRAVGFFFIKPNKAVRIAAYRALASIGTPHASRLVKEAATDRDAEVAATAQTLAAQIGSDTPVLTGP